MKVINLLNKIANGEELPEQIKYDNDIWKYDEMARDYLLIDKSGEEYLLCEELNLMYALNDEVEIIEEDKKIKKVHDCFISTDNKEIQFLIDNINQLGNKVNEIIDKINEDK